MDASNVISLLGAVAMFLFGMSTMTGGLEKLSSGRLEGIMERLTSNLFMSVLIIKVCNDVIYNILLNDCS